MITIFLCANKCAYYVNRCDAESPHIENNLHTMNTLAHSAPYNYSPAHVYPMDSSLSRSEAVSLTHEIISRCHYYFTQYLEDSLSVRNYDVSSKKTYDQRSLTFSDAHLVTQLLIQILSHSTPVHSDRFELVFNNEDLNESVEVSLLKNGVKCPEYCSQLVLEECSLKQIQTCVENLVNAVL